MAERQCKAYRDFYFRNFKQKRTIKFNLFLMQAAFYHEQSAQTKIY